MQGGSIHREYELHELIWLWRTAELPHDTEYQDEFGAWQPVRVGRKSELLATSSISGETALIGLIRQLACGKTILNLSPEHRDYVFPPSRVQPKSD
jgi:hypothetical protein